LCDCPGLVFPTFVSTKADMYCNGLMGIDNLRDHRGPIALICERIPRKILETVYGISLPKPTEEEDQNRKPRYDELLQNYARVRGFFGATGLPNESQAARIILKDYFAGALCFVFPPEGIDPSVFNKDTIHRKYLLREEKEMEKKKDNTKTTATTQTTTTTTKQTQKQDQTKKNPKNSVSKPKSLTIIDNEREELLNNVTARTKDKRTSTEKPFTRPKTLHSPIPVSQLKKIVNKSKEKLIQKEEQNQLQQQ